MSEYIVVTDRPENIHAPVSVAVPFAPFHGGYPRARSLQEYGALRKLTACRHQKLYVMMPDLILEHQLEAMDAFLQQIMDSDGIYYGDEAVLMTMKQAGYKGLLIFQPETLACSSADVNRLQQWGADVVSLAHELSLEEITDIAADASHLEVLIHGWYPVLYSGRRLVSNYGQAIGSSLEDGVYALQESTRQDILPLVQQKQGTFVFSEGPMESGQVMEALKQAGIERFRIDGRFFDDGTLQDILRFYLEGKGSVTGRSDWYRKESLVRKEKS